MRRNQSVHNDSMAAREDRHSIEEAIADALDSDDPALIRLDASAIREAIADALSELRQIEARVSELIGPLESRIDALEQALKRISDSRP